MTDHQAPFVKTPTSAPGPGQADAGKANQGAGTEGPTQSSWAERAAQASPAMAQWFTLKEQVPDTLLLFRMGDFYELFYEDAHTAATALDIALTARGKHSDSPIPMCGVPFHSVDAYLRRLIQRGFRVALAEQTEKPSKGRKGPLPRSIVRILTPGTLTEDELLESARPNLLMALAPPPAHVQGQGGEWGVAWMDFSTGTVDVQSTTALGLDELLGRLKPAEIIIHDREALPAAWRPYAQAPDGGARGRRSALNAARARTTMAQAWHVHDAASLGAVTDNQAIACAMMLDYARMSQAGTLPRLAPPVVHREGHAMGLDSATRASLDLLEGRDGSTANTLFEALDNTLTAGGGRLLAERIANPLTYLATIQQRQRDWAWLAENDNLAEQVRAHLKGLPDASRALGRIASNRALPRDLAAIRDTLAALMALHVLLGRAPQTPWAAPEPALAARLASLHAMLAQALAEELPARATEDGVIASGFDVELDRLRTLRDDSQQAIMTMQAGLAERYGAPRLRVRHHSQLGHVIEVPAREGERLRAHPELHIRQGTANLARFSNQALDELNSTLAEAAELSTEREQGLVQKLVEAIMALEALPALIQNMAALDVAQSCAALARTGRWCIPELTEDASFDLRQCRHPVVERAMEGQRAKGGGGAPFTPNSCALPPTERVMLLTGPNMAGKSTFLRQNALAIIMAQAGLPVPALSARIGLVDRLFSRVGSADDLARGQSTFMVEMTETAALLNQAGPRSFVIVDELGRGTAPLDGLALARASLEALHDSIRARTIFATHFHALANLTAELPAMRPWAMKVREWEGQLVFQHEVAPGVAGRSWGIHVARLAGVPAPILERAQALLNQMQARRKPARTPHQPEHPPATWQAQGVGASDLFTNQATLSPTAESSRTGRTASGVKEASEMPPQASSVAEGGSLNPLAKPTFTLTLPTENASADTAPALRAFLKNPDPDSLSPRQAHALLYELGDLLKKPQ
ncbi:DNA mismatch repair protein MutS [Formicincola oecophyllae]|uniref:DNA mismatch repair protein MutS n=1 Tax=Formicincola oecophyllae TaxID=2558361 RepID=A0A4Y6UAF1_9PROT|nr:DNA mismatch repair protein MutS [Formicincola oecophyllae]QDH13920.1 DNA mismatch repair protein MutS [Formicincola oecophyllae]